MRPFSQEPKDAGSMRKCLCLMLVLLLVPYAVTASTPLTVTFIDVGQGDCAWLHLPNGDDVLVDGGKPRLAPRWLRT